MPAKKQKKPLHNYFFDASFHMNRAENAIEKLDFSEAIVSLLRAIRIDKGNIEYKMRLAEVYAIIEQYDLSNNILFEIYASDKTATDVFFNIGQNYFHQNKIDTAAYYLNTFAALNLDPEDPYDSEVFNILEADKKADGYRLVHPEKTPPNDRILSIANNLVHDFKFKEATHLFRVALSRDTENTLIKNNLALSLVFQKEYSEAEKLTEELLFDAPDDFFALSTQCALYHLTKNEEKRQSTLNKLLAYKTEDMGELYKLATVLCEIGEHLAAAERLKKVYENRQYDDQLLLLLALAYYNANDLDKSLKYFVKLHRLYENNQTAKFYICYISDIKSGKLKKPQRPLPYSDILPEKEVESRINYLKEVSSLPLNEMQERWTSDPMFCYYAEWAMGLSSDKVVSSTIAIVAYAGGEKFLKKFLISVESGAYQKKEIIEKLVEFTSAKQIDYLYDDIFTTAIVKRPKNLATAPKEFNTAFALAFSMFCFVTEDFEQNLSRTLSLMIKAAQEKEQAEELKNPSAIAAVLCYKSDVKDLMSKKSFLCDVFDISLKTFNKYLSILS